MQNPNPPGNHNAAAAPLQEDDANLPGAFFTQSDWTGQVCRETWYGKHHPWRRILRFCVVSSWAWTASTLVWLYTDVFAAVDDTGNGLIVPIMQLDLTPRELERIKDTHYQCIQSLCENIGRTVEVACVVNDDGRSAHLELGEDQPELVFFTEECHFATEATFGMRYLDGDETIGSKPIAFLRIQTEEIPANVTAAAQKTSNTPSSILTLLPDCSITVNPSPMMNAEDMENIRQTLNVDVAEWEDSVFSGIDSQTGTDIYVKANLLGLPNHAKPPGYRESHVLKNLFCPEEMSDEIQEVILPNAGVIYHLVMECRHLLLAGGLSLYSYALSFGTLAWLMVRVLFPAWIMKRFLSWPESIGYWHIWRSLLLLCVVSRMGANNSWALTAAMVIGACYYRDTQAAMEWAFLGILAWGAPDTVYPVLDSFFSDGGAWQRAWQQIDFLGIVPWSFHVLVVGEGWWKLVTLYVVGRSYQSLRRSLRPVTNELEQTQLYDIHPGQKPQAPRHNEHVKVD